MNRIRNKALTFFSICFFLCLLCVYVKLGTDAFATNTSIPPLDCTSYSPYKDDINEYATPEEIEKDLILIHRYTSCVRIYTTKNGLDVVPEIAERLNMTVILGTWIDKVSLSENKKEIDRAILLSNTHANIRMIVVGNEINSFNWNKVDKITYISYLKYIKSKTSTPLAITVLGDSVESEFGVYDYVDIVGLHIFPYWSGVNDTRDEPDFAVRRVEAARHFIQDTLKLQGKQVMVLEYGQPWVGLNMGKNISSLAAQRTYINAVSTQLHNAGIFANYYELVSEKRIGDSDGYVYRLWGVLTHSGENIVRVQRIMFAYVVFGVLILFFLTLYRMKKRTIRFSASAALQVLSVYMAFGYMIYTIRSIFGGDYWLYQFICLVPIGAFCIVCIKTIFELSPVAQSAPTTPEPGLHESEHSQKVAIIIPSKVEDLGIVQKTLESCLKQTYANIEILFVNNGQQEDSYRRDVEHLSASYRDPRIRYVYFENTKKNKSSALNHAVRLVSPDAAYILFVDADYVLIPEAVEKGLAYFSDTRIRCVQFPQAYQSGVGFIGEMARLEQDCVAHFFQPLRNKTNSVIVNGTLCFFRRTVFEGYSWDEDTVCEDAMLGAELQLRNEKVLYVEEVIGKGVAPRNMRELLIQRFRWAAGASQVLKRLLFSRDAYANAPVLLQYILGWLPWLMLIPLLIYIPVYIVFLFRIKSYFHFFPVFAPIQLVMAGTLLAMSVYGFLGIRARLGWSFGMFIQSVVYQLALVNTIAFGMLYGFLKKRIDFRGTRGVGRQTGYARSLAWVVPLALCVAFGLIILKIWRYNQYLHNGLTELNTLLPIVFCLLPQAAGLWLYAIDKFRK
jgi:cellulose synthase/poly-beta-1,6-N-acetylglucosamine synthase-like glycosyltransferase/exo-beta-1,3-glucanase (GH17 family)